MGRIQLSAHQIEALSRINNGSILHGGVGSGKSRTALAYYYTLHGGNVETCSKMRNPCDLYIITTAKKRDSLEWDDEMAAFLLSKNGDLNAYDNKVVIDSWNNIGKYADVHGAFFIFDEQRVVGSGAWVKAFLRIARHNRWILLSATPGDTWSDYIPVFIANGFYKNRTQFRQEHIVMRPFTKFPQIDHYINTGRLIRLRDRILVDMDFKRLTVQHHEFIDTTFDRRAYREITKTRWNPWEDKPIETPGEFCQCLRRCVSDTDSRRLTMLELFEAHPRMIVFYNFDYERDILYDLFPLAQEWSGHKHQPVPEGDSWVYLVQYNAGAEGWNCTRTDTIVFYSENYSYKMMEQAAGRIDRMNTKYIDLWYYHLTSKSSIELAIRRALVEKKQFNEMRFVGRFNFKEEKYESSKSSYDVRERASEICRSRIN